jgi:hypothetical protein
MAVGICRSSFCSHLLNDCPTTARKVLMSLKDKLEIGLKPDAPFRKDNLPDFQKDDPACDVAATPGETPSVEGARKECTLPPVKQEQLEKESARAEDRQQKRPAAPRRTSTGR